MCKTRVNAHSVKYSQIQNKCGKITKKQNKKKKHLGIPFDNSSSSSSNNICFCSLPSLWFVVEISFGNVLTASLFTFFFPCTEFKTLCWKKKKAFKDNDPEIIRRYIYIYTPLNHKAGVKCSYVYILLKKTFKD